MSKLGAYVSSAYWRDSGTPKSFLAACHDVLSGNVGRSADFRYANTSPAANIPKNVTPLPVEIGDRCEIGADATIGGRTTLRRGCEVGNGATVEGSMLFEGAGRR